MQVGFINNLSNVWHHSSAFGITVSSGNANTYVGGTSVSSGTINAASSGDVLMLAVDFDNKKFFYGINGTWENSGDPVAGTGEVISGWNTADYYFGVRNHSVGGVQTAIKHNYISTSSTQVTIPYSIDKLDDVDTSTVAPTDGQALLWDNTAQKWEPGTVSGGGGATAIDDLSDVDTSTAAPTNGQVLTWDGSQWEPATPTTSGLPSANDGEALIYENGQWVAGPVVGGVNYTAGGDADFSSVSLLLLGNGADGSTTFTDSSSNSLTITANGGAEISTANYKFGGASALFDANGDYLSIASNTLLNLDGDFTIEAWIYLSSSTPNWPTILGSGQTSFVSGCSYFMVNSQSSSNHRIRLGNYTNAVESTGLISLNTWTHVAVTRSGTTVRLFIDGVLDSTHTSSLTYHFDNTETQIGKNGWDGTNGQWLGNIDDLRVTKGVARYTSSFTAPTAELLTGSSGSAVTIPYSIDKLDDVDTSTVAPTDGQALLWDNTASKWEPGTVSSGTSLPSGSSDGEALIWENNAWAVGPVIGGVDYTPSGGDANFSSVELLLLGNGTNGSTAITDSSSNALTVTANGNAQISTTQSKFGGASIYFDGTGDYLSTPNQSWMAFGTNEFTIECWFYISANSGTVGDGTRPGTLVANYPTSGSTSNGWLFRLLGDTSTTGTGLDFFGRDSSGNIIGQVTYNGTISQSAWHHAAVVRETTIVKLYLDGTEVASTSLAASDSFTAAHPLYVATISFSNWQGYFNGYIDDLRITSGVARYTANFTPPTAELPTTSGTAVTIPAADSIRTLLGIGEYTDDTAAGTGGVASGALYYNTTSSDYRLKS